MVVRTGLNGALDGDVLREELVASLGSLREGCRNGDSFPLIPWCSGPIFLKHFRPQAHNYFCLNYLKVSLNRKYNKN